jgi:hypothetical protein
MTTKDAIERREVAVDIRNHSENGKLRDYFAAAGAGTRSSVLSHTKSSLL